VPWTEWSSLPLALRVAIVVLGLGCVALLALVVLQWAPQWLATEGLKGKDRAEEVSRARTGLLAALAGLIAIVGAAFTGLSYRLNRAGQITERFTRAIDQLGNPKLDVRLGGIYALERIARDSRDDHPQIVEVLTAYVREHARWRPGTGEARTLGGAPVRTHAQSIEAIHALERIAQGSPAETDGDLVHPPTEMDDQAQTAMMPTDVQAAMSVLGRRDAAKDRFGARLDLAGTDLRSVNLERANLQDANLVGANLQGAVAFEANLRRALLQETNLQGAWLDSVSLQGAWGSGARLQDAKLYGANLQEARLAKANLEHAHLYEANLEGANLHGANLQNANLCRAKMRDANLTNANLGAVVYSAATEWPAGFNPNEHGARLLSDVDAQASSVSSPE
jgi:hypothetical protein